jgi:plasmid maintenance system antidote protein VapI
LRAALEYLRRGFSVVPQLPGAKHPCVKWKRYQERLPTEEELRGWFRHWPQAGLAVILGPVSGLFAIDVDGPEAHEALVARLGAQPVAPKVLSGSGKPFRYHLFFRHPDVATLAKFTPWHPKLEFRGHRGIIILPPSRHKSGNCYRFADGRSFDDRELPEVPALIVEELAARACRKRAARPAAPGMAGGVPNTQVLPLTAVQQQAHAYLARIPPAVQGQGGDKLTYTVACRLALGFDLTPEQALPLLQEYGLRCLPPWTDDELRHKLERADQEPGERGYLLDRTRGVSGRPTTASPTPPARPADDGSAAHVPLLDGVRDFGMYDPDRARFFELIGSTHGLFEGAAGWPSAEGLLAEVRAGEHADLAAAVRGAVGQGRGLLWKDDRGCAWAARLFPAAGDPGGRDYLAVAFCAQTAARLLDWRGPEHRRHAFNNELADPAAWQAADLRGRLGRIASGLRLFRPARRLLWYLHARVLDRQRDELVLSDVELAEVVWGADRSRRPANWRSQLFTTLASLTAIHLGSLTVDGGQLSHTLAGLGAIPLVAVSDLRRRKGEADCCCPDCALWSSGRPHHHFAVTVQPWPFLGRLARFFVDTDRDEVRYFDFNPDVASEVRGLREDFFAEASALANINGPYERQALRERRKEHKAEVRQLREKHQARFAGVVSTALLPLVFGDALGLTAGQRRLLLAMMREVTRAARKLQRRRPDRAHVYEGARVPGPGRRGTVVCRLLSPANQYMGCNGNGKQHWGRGYRPGTWMARAGYPVPADEPGFRAGLRAFLDDLGGLVKTLGVVAVGVTRGETFDLDKLREMARSGQVHELRTLQSVCLRFYLPAEYLTNWRQQVARAVAGPEVALAPSPDRQLPELRAAVRRLGITQQELADHLGRHRTAVNKLLRGQRCSERLLRAAWAFVRSREGPQAGA